MHLRDVPHSVDKSEDATHQLEGLLHELDIIAPRLPREALRAAAAHVATLANSANPGDVVASTSSSSAWSSRGEHTDPKG